MDIRLALMCGTDIPVPECQLIIHQPRIKEIAMIGEKDFFTGIQCLCVDKKMVVQDESLLQDTNNFQIFMTVMQEKEASDKKFAVQQIFPLIFPAYKTMMTPRSIVLRGQNNDTITIDETNFDFLQEVLLQICCLKTGPADTRNYNPESKKAREIAEKLMKGRQKIAAEKGDSNASVFSQYLSVLTVGLHSMSLQDLTNLTVFQFYDLIERYSLYTNWDMDIRSRLAGGKPDGQPDNWMKNIH